MTHSLHGNFEDRAFHGFTALVNLSYSFGFFMVPTHSSRFSEYPLLSGLPQMRVLPSISALVRRFEFHEESVPGLDTQFHEQQEKLWSSCSIFNVSMCAHLCTGLPSPLVGVFTQCSSVETLRHLCSCFRGVTVCRTWRCSRWCAPPWCAMASVPSMPSTLSQASSALLSPSLGTGELSASHHKQQTVTNHPFSALIIVTCHLK